MRYYRYLYIQEELNAKKEKILKKLENKKFLMNLHLITLSQNPQNHLEIHSSKYLFQPGFPQEHLFIIGIVKGYDDALAFVERLTQEVYDATGQLDIRSYIMRKEQED